MKISAFVFSLLVALTWVRLSYNAAFIIAVFLSDEVHFVLL